MPWRRSRRTPTSLFLAGWNETAYANNGSVWATQNANDNVFASLSATQKAAILLSFLPVEGTGTGEARTDWDFVSGCTPVEPTYPPPGGFIAVGLAVAGPNNTVRYKLTIPACTGYCYEVYGNPTLADVEWAALPLSLTQTGSIDRHKHVATAEGSLPIYVEAAATKGFYEVS